MLHQVGARYRSRCYLASDAVMSSAVVINGTFVKIFVRRGTQTVHSDISDAHVPHPRQAGKSLTSRPITALG